MRCTTVDNRGVLRYYEVAPDLWYPEIVEVTGIAPGLEIEPSLRQYVHMDYWVQGQFQMIPEGMTYALTGVHLFVASDDNKSSGMRLTIDTETYRSLKLSELQSWIGEGASSAEADIPDRAEMWSLLPHAEEVGTRDNPELVETARIYAAGTLSGRRPQRDVSEKLGVSIATAGRRVRKAMQEGYLSQIVIFDQQDDEQERAEKVSTAQQLRRKWEDSGDHAP